MKDISIYFEQIIWEDQHKADQLGKSIVKNDQSGFPELTNKGIALIFVPEYRNHKYQPKVQDYFRRHLYSLYKNSGWNFTIYDLGTIRPGENVSDTYFALSQAVTELIKQNILPLVVGGSQDLTFAMYNAYENLEQIINTCSVDAKLDLGDPDSALTYDGFLSHILLKRPCYLFNHASIGLQMPLISSKELDLFEKLYFDYCRLGEFNADFRTAEPLLRNTDLLSIDLTSIRFSETGNKEAQINGFYADQMCQIAKYAGVSDKLSALGLFNVLSEHDDKLYELIAQIIWYFIDGYAQRKGDFPVGSKKDYMRFSVSMDDFEDEIVFYKSNKSERWWMEVPYPLEKGRKYERHLMVPCDAVDYERAMKNEMPNLWWRTYQKLS